MPSQSSTPNASTSKLASSTPRHPTDNVHLLVLLHGMWGNPSHLGELQRIICETKQTASLSPDTDARLEVILPESNAEDATYDGIDWGGERIAKEIIDHTAALAATGEKVTKISFTGYSLGGVIARYVLGILHQRRFFDSVKPVNYTSIATPHLGLPKYDTFFGKLSRTLGPKLLSRTGTQFFATDAWGPRGRPLVEVMADPNQIFFKALALFPHLSIYANGVNDLTVPYVTAALEVSDPFLDYQDTGLTVEYMPNYMPMVKSYSIPDTPPVKPKKTAFERVSGFLSQKNPGPPGLVFGFPGNLVMYAVLPLMMPAIFTLAFTRLALSAKGSKNRIAALEADAATRSGEDEGFPQRLVHAVADLEQSLEENLTQMTAIGDSSNSTHVAAPEVALDTTSTAPVSSDLKAPTPGATTSSNSLEDTSKLHPSIMATEKANATPPGTPDERGEAKDRRKCSSKRNTASSTSLREDSARKAAGAAPPVLSDMQIKAAGNLSSIPQLRKYTAFIETTRFSHAAIVVREPKKFGWGEDSYGVLRHWADEFVL